MGKLAPIDISDTKDIHQIMDKCHNAFKESMLSKENKNHIENKKVIVPISWKEYKAVPFWHAASIDEKVSGKLNEDDLPCKKDICTTLCECNCLSGNETIVLHSKKRRKCIFRATRVNWISQIIEMYNAADQRVKYWEKTKKKKSRIHLRYEEKEVDYLVVFENKNEKAVTFITAFPIFPGEKERFEKEYIKNGGLQIKNQ